MTEQTCANSVIMSENAG